MDPPEKQSDISRNTDAAPPITSRLHRRVFGLLIGLAAWFALAVWGFAGVGETDYLLVIVSGFIFVVMALVLILSRVGRTHRPTNDDSAKAGNKALSFYDWATSDFDTWQGRLSGMQAAIMILLPIAAAAIGMTAFAVAFHFAENGA